MNVWLLHVGEELPGDPNPRLFRYGRLASELASRGHGVLRWAPTFQHFRKLQRYDADCRVEAADGYQIQFLYAPGYRSNVSWRRLSMYRRLASRFRVAADGEDRPDLIVAGLPSVEWCREAIVYGRKHGVPVVLDIRDLWPDIYAYLAPPFARGAAMRALGPMRRSAGRLFAQADALSAVSQTYLDWALGLAGRSRRDDDRVYPLGYTRHALGDDERTELVTELRAAGLDRSRTICCFVGLLEKSYDIAGLVGAARCLEEESPGEYQIVVAGSGSKGAELRREAERNPSLVALGWVEPRMIGALLGVSRVGLAAYAEGALQSLPNKAFEYLSAGLALVSSLPGELRELIQTKGLGDSYLAGDGAALAAAIKRVTSSSERLGAISSRASRLFDDQYDAGLIHARFADDLESLATRLLAEAVAA